MNALLSAKTNDNSTKNGLYGISDVVTASVQSEKTCLKKLIMMMKMIIIIIIIIMNKSQKMTVSRGHQKLTSEVKLPEK